MSTKGAVVVRVILMCVMGAAACLLARRFGYVIPLAAAYEVAVQAVPGCTCFQLANDRGFFTMDAAPQTTDASR